MEKDDEYKVGVEFEMDAIEAGNNANLELKYYLNEQKTCYFEFDGNKTLEFVTNPYQWSEESSATDALFKDLLLAESKLHDYYLNQGKNETDLEKAATEEQGKGKSLKINSFWPLGVPQITFQFPIHQYENLRNFAKRVLKSNFSSFSCFDFDMPDYLGIGFENERFVLEIKGLAYLCIATIKSLRKIKLAPRESGPKGCLAFMSRLSFRSMYLGLTQEQRKNFNYYIETALKDTNINKTDKLFQDYFTSFGRQLSDMLKEKKINDFTVQDFIDSVTKDNYDYSWETPSSGKDKEKEEDEKGMYNILLKVRTMYAKRNPNTTDLLSPPPFMAEDYSMGALKELKLSNHFVLEFRAAAGSIFYAKEINDQRWVLSSSAEEKETTVFYFYHSVIQTFEELFMPDSTLKKIESWEIKQLQGVLSYINRNHLWRCIVRIQRRTLYTGDQKMDLINAFKTVIRALIAINKDAFVTKFAKIFQFGKPLDGQLEMNDKIHSSFCYIATQFLLEYDPHLKDFKK